MRDRLGVLVDAGKRQEPSRKRAADEKSLQTESRRAMQFTQWPRQDRKMLAIEHSREEFQRASSRVSERIGATKRRDLKSA
jgi:hypothetical protein